MAGAKPNSPSELCAAIGTEPHPGQASRSRIALRHRLVASVFRAVRDCPFAGMLDGTARRLSGAKALGRSAAPPCAPAIPARPGSRRTSPSLRASELKEKVLGNR